MIVSAYVRYVVSLCTEMWVNVRAAPVKVQCQVPFWSALWTKH